MMKRVADTLLSYVFSAFVLHLAWNLIMVSQFNLPHAHFMQVYSLVIFGDITLASIAYFIRREKERNER